MYLPSGAVPYDDSCRITLTILRNNPSIDVLESESLACYGITCGPQTMIFNQPVKITIPHSSIIMNPHEVKPDTICRIWDSIKNLPRTLRNQSSSSPDKPPYCKLYKRHLELYINHCAEWWVLIPLGEHVIRQQLTCSLYVPDKIRRRQEFVVNLQMYKDVPGIEAIIKEESRQQSYHKCHRSVPFSIESMSGDVSITCVREGEEVENQIVPLRELQARLSQCTSLNIPPSGNDPNFAVITIRITQAGRLGNSRSLVFMIRYTDGPECVTLSEQINFNRKIEEVKNSDLKSDLLTIAQTMNVNQFYDLGTALGFTIAELDRVEYGRLRQQATYDMLVVWRARQTSTRVAKDTLITLMESFNLSSNDTTFPDISPTEEIPDSTMLQVARHISKDKFYEIGDQLGFTKEELKDIVHRSLSNRKDANIQMLSMWKASQISSDKPDDTLKMIWESLNDASKATDMNDAESGNENDETPLVSEVKFDQPSQQEHDEDDESEDWKIIESDKDETAADIDSYGGSPSTSELCRVGDPVATVTLALEVAKALFLDADDIVALLAPRNPVLMKTLALQLLHRWYGGLGRQEKEEKMATLLQGYSIEETQTGFDEISAKICKTPDLVDLSKRLHLPASEALHVISSLTFEPALIRQVVQQMFQRWAKQGGTRLRLLELAQAFNFNDAAKYIATAMEHHPDFLDPLSHGMIDHDGGELKLDEPGTRICIPPGAILKGVSTVVTLTVPRRTSSHIPLEVGEVLITPIIQCSISEELIKPATVSLPCCFAPDHKMGNDEVRVKLYTKLRPGEFGKSSRSAQISEDKIVFSTRHLQMCALSSTDVHGVQFTCEVSHTYSPHKPAFRVRLAHPYSGYLTEVNERKENLSKELYHEAMVINFNLDSTDHDIRLWCMSELEQLQNTVPVGHLLAGGCDTCTFDLLPPCTTRYKRSVCFRIEQGATTLAEQQITFNNQDDTKRASQQSTCCIVI